MPTAASIRTAEFILPVCPTVAFFYCKCPRRPVWWTEYGTNDPKRKPRDASECIPAYHSANLRKHGCTPTGTWGSERKWGGCWERSKSTNLNIITWAQCTPLITHVLTLPTVLTTIVSTHLRNVNNHTHTHTFFAFIQLANYSCLASLSRFCLPCKVQFLRVKIGIPYLWFCSRNFWHNQFPQVEIYCLLDIVPKMWKKYSIVFHPLHLNNYEDR